MHLIYAGPSTEVAIYDPATDDFLYVANGEPTEVPADLAKSLLNQSVWSKAQTTKAETKAATQPKEQSK
jgi:hypothetical protein